jgi:XRE family transcriptional regulator, regulator of sulfur utilization
MQLPPEFLADNLRRLRSERGLIAAELCARSGVARATLSQIEAGRGNPRLETLHDLAGALGVELGDLLAPPSESGATVIRRDDGLDITDATIPGRLVRSVTFPTALVEFYDNQIPVGIRSVSASHGVGAHEHVYVVEGRVLAGPVAAPVELAPGDYAAYPADRPHVWECVGDQSARVWITQVMPRPGG